MAKKNFSLNYLFATFFYSGYLPKAPGTWGTLASLIVLFIPTEFRFNSLLILLIASFFLSLYSIKLIEKESGYDPGFVVIDEAIGMWILLLFDFINNDIYFLLLSIILFRVFDIWKPYPINKVNNKKGAFFVVFDDVLASLYSLAILGILNYFLMQHK